MQVSALRKSHPYYPFPMAIFPKLHQPSAYYLPLSHIPTEAWAISIIIINAMKHRLLLFVLFLLITSSLFSQEELSEKLTGTTKKLILSNTRNILLNNYIFPDKAATIVKYLKDQDDNGKYIEKPIQEIWPMP